MAREMEREKQKERERDDGKADVNVERLVHGGRFPSGLDMGDFNPVDGSNIIDPKLESFLAGPSPTAADIESLINDPTFPPTSNPTFASLGPEERRMQMSAWADGLPGARRMARELEREKQKEREREEEKGDKNVEGLVRGRRFNFGYDMGEFTLANESEIPENHSATDSNSDESPPPTTNPTKDTISSSNNNFYNIPPYQRRYRLQGRPSPYNDDASSDKKKQAMTKLWLEQNPTLVFRLPSPEAGEEDDDDGDDNEHADNLIQVRRVAPLKGGNAHALAVNPTRARHVPSPSDGDDDAAHLDDPVRVQRVAAMEDEDAHAPPVANPARVWRVPSPSDDDDDDNGNGGNEAPLQTASAAAEGERYTLRKIPVVRDLRTGGHSVTSPGDAEWVRENAIISRTGVERKGKRGRRAKKKIPRDNGVMYERNGYRDELYKAF